VTTIASDSSVLAGIREAREPKRRLPLVEKYLREQQSMTAVEQFAQRHADADQPLREPYYRALLPASPPEAGQQYAFSVDLDACTGCKACVTACHNLNGLDDAEAWRSVGLLHGGTAAAPVQQTVTTACHHCLDPACMNGCPVGAYEKDALTGIVKHLDDQCIGCQYCTFTCPYDVPKYSAARGIVRKCDMCSDRLAVGEAPACVQACPNEAIAITLVDKAQVLEDAQGSAFVPGAPSPSITAPTTVYRTERALPRNLLPANFYAVKPAHEHRPLVLMLVLTQLSVGAFSVDAIGARFVPASAMASLAPLHAVVAVAFGVAALGASIFHLGRPLYAFRAILGLRTSWMSREILAFGLFAPLAMLYAASFWAPLPIPLWVRDSLLSSVVAAGIGGVACSVLIYHVTRRAWWHATSTAFKFAMTAVVLGLATTNLTLAIGAQILDPADRPALASLVATVVRLLLLAGIAKALGELGSLLSLRDRSYSELKRSAVLLTHDLRGYLVLRLVLLGLGLLVSATQAFGTPSVAATAVAFVALVLGELAERTLFFAAMCTPAMPGNHQ
jgi:Fe-S-cluster-containing dehydrogenase component/DMSO reductase anchor subunit